MMVIHDLAYADICFDGYRAPSFLEVEGAKDVGVEFFSLSKSYNMPGWRVGFAVGNKRLIGALTRIKSYLDISDRYRSRRDVLVDCLGKAGWEIEKPKATMFVWARIPEAFRRMGSLEFSKMLLKEAGVAVSPGIGFGEYGDEYVRLALVENRQRIRQAGKGIKKAFDKRLAKAR
jgi:alanine-synthesizing transaminase